MGQTFSILYTVHSMLQDCTSVFFLLFQQDPENHNKNEREPYLSGNGGHFIFGKKSKGDLQICSKNVLKSCILYERKCNLSVVDVRWKLERSEKLYF